MRVPFWIVFPCCLVAGAQAALYSPRVNNIRIFAHCLEDRPRAVAPVILTHEWSENGVRRSKQVRLEGPGEYDIEAGADPVDESIEITVPAWRELPSRIAKKPA